MHTRIYHQASTPLMQISIPMTKNAMLRPSFLSPGYGAKSPLDESEQGVSEPPYYTAHSLKPSCLSYDFSQVSLLPPAQSELVQAKLTIGRADDKYEQEADRVAEQVMHAPEPTVDHHKEPVPDQFTPLIQRRLRPKERPVSRRTLSTASCTPQSGIHSLQGRGQPLSQSERNYFEPKFGVDFSQVRIHSHRRDSELAQNIHARAFTTGKHIVFGPGFYRPGTTEGDYLLAHELTHVVQQNYRHSDSAPLLQRSPYPNCPSTRDAEIDDARPGAVSLVNDAIRALNRILSPTGQAPAGVPTLRTRSTPSINIPDELGRCFTCHFNHPSTSHTLIRNTILARYTNILAIIQDDSRYECAAQSQCVCPDHSRPDWRAYAHCPGGLQIYICPAFSDTDVGLLVNNRRLTLIHEAAHVDGACGDTYVDTPAYPPADGELNADSYASFAWHASLILHGNQACPCRTP